MSESTILADFPVCSGCGSTNKISELSVETLKANGKIPADAFTCIRKVVSPLQQPVLAAITVPALVVSFDVCAACGTERCTRAEIVQMPISMQTQQMPAQRKGNSNNQFTIN
jgi:hypothetical protein